MNFFKKLKKYLGKNVKDDKDIDNYLNGEYEINPYFESIRISIIYGILGLLWILAI